MSSLSPKMSEAFPAPAEATTGQERARLYSVLAGVFCSPPTQESRRAISAMTAALNLECPSETPLDLLHREFMDLFVVPNPRYVAPYESAYRDRSVLPAGPGTQATEQVVGRLLMGESTLAVRQCFLEAGVEPVEDLPDHLSNELRLLAHLWASEAGVSSGNGNRHGLRSRVRDEHLLKWIGPLRQKVSEQECLGFYSAALDLTEVMLHNDEADGAL